jgi:hypothetical protein
MAVDVGGDGEWKVIIKATLAQYGSPIPDENFLPSFTKSLPR